MSSGVGLSNITWAQCDSPDIRPESVHLIETVRCSPADGIVNRDAHLARLTASARELGFQFHRARAAAELDDWASRGVEVVLRLLLHPSGKTSIEARELPANLGSAVTVGIDSVPMPSRAWWTRHKTTHRAPYDDARARRPTVDDVILYNTDGDVTESTMANVAVFVDGLWKTPPLSTGCLPGVERAIRLRAGDIVEGSITQADVRRARHLMLISSVRGVRSASLASPDHRGQTI